MKRAISLLLIALVSISAFCGFDTKGKYVSVEPIKIPDGTYNEYSIADFEYSSDWDVSNTGGHGVLDARSDMNSDVKIMTDNTLHSKVARFGTIFMGDSSYTCHCLYALRHMDESDKPFVIKNEDLDNSYLCFKIYVHNVNRLPAETCFELSETVDKREFQMSILQSNKSTDKGLNELLNNALVDYPDTWIQANIPLSSIPGQGKGEKISTPGKFGDTKDFTVTNFRAFLLPEYSMEVDAPYFMLDDVKVVTYVKSQKTPDKSSNSTTYTGSAKSSGTSTVTNKSSKKSNPEISNNTKDIYDQNDENEVDEVTYIEDEEDEGYEDYEAQKNNTSKKSSAKKGNSTLIIITVAVCSLAVLSAIGFAVYMFLSKKKKAPETDGNK